MQYQSMDKSKHQTTPYAQLYFANQDVNEKAKMISILSYLTILGWLGAMIMYGEHKSSFTCFHLRQSLGLIITGAILMLIPLIGWLLTITVFFAWLYSLYHVVQGHQVSVPVLGEFYQTHLDFIK